MTVLVKSLLEKQRKSLESFFTELDLDAVQKVLDKLLACTGVVILSGVGKSGHIAQKISATFVSTGTRSMYLCPGNALHGDLGFATNQDVFLLFSKSGESQELLDLLPHIKKRNAFIIAVVSKLSSHLAEFSDLSVCLPFDEELCPFNLAPTTSTAVQLLFGDCLAVALMQYKGFTIGDFAANHPAGFLGRKITMKVADLMLQNASLPICKTEDRLIEVLHELSAKKCGCLLICDDQMRLEGVFTDGDLRRAIQTKGGEALEMKLSQLMTTSPLTTNPQLLAIHAAGQMEENPSRLVMALPVVEEGKVVGLLRMHDIVQAGLR